MNTSTRDVLIIGGGHNGLVTAFYLAKAGFKPLYSNVEPRSAAQPSRTNFIPDFAAPRCRTAPGLFAGISFATCNSKNTA